MGITSLLVLVSVVGTDVFWTPLVWGRSWYGPPLLTALAFTFGGAVGLSAIGHSWARLLEYRPLMQWGKISYGIYLFHPFTFLLIDTVIHKPYQRESYFVSASVILAKLLLTYVVAWTSWQLIEAPVNRLKHRFSEGAERQAEISSELVSNSPVLSP